MDRRRNSAEYDGPDKRDKITFWQGNQVKFWRSGVITLLMLLGGIGVWGIGQITEIPKVYATQKVVNAMVDRMDAHFLHVQNSLDSINEYLREKK